VARARRGYAGIAIDLGASVCRFYRLSGGSVEIVRVLHQRRNLAKAFPKTEP
jgi:plasmid stabilization system protein ParE